ncbi:MAG TPA: YciI family protein [Vicinamibacterales bacterium]|nr:YciI family protein [Vicinamibacterales bacterium]
MQYVMLVYRGATPLQGTEEWKALPEAEQKQIFAGYAALGKAEGVTIGTPVGLPENATTVRLKDGKTQITHGPYVGVSEAIGAYFIVEANDIDAVLELAAQTPAVKYGGAVEVRPSEAYWERK